LPDFAAVPVLPDGLVWTDGRVADGLEGADEPVDGLAWPEGLPVAGRVTVVLGLRSFDGFAAGRFAEPDCLETVPDCLVTEPDCLLTEPDCLVTVPDDFELPGLVSVTLVLLPLRACASASDPDATNASDTNIAASAVLIVLIIVQF